MQSVPHNAWPFCPDEVCSGLRELCPNIFAVADVHADRLNSNVFRVRSSAMDGGGPSVVVKRLAPSIAQRNERIIRRWLPGLGLSDIAPAVVGTIVDQSRSWAWQAYEDLGATVLDSRNPDTGVVAAAVDLIGQLHTRAAGSTLLTECRQHLDDLGMPYFVSNIGDAIAGLESLSALEGRFTKAQQMVRARLLERLQVLRESIPFRSQLMLERGGPYTLLHGDLWNINAVVAPTEHGSRVRLIDWDRAGVGPIAYDLSTFLYRFPQSERTWILERYRDAVCRAGWRLPNAADLNVLFETVECARYANRIIWPAAALLTESDESGHDELAQILGWFEALEPVLSTEETRTA